MPALKNARHERFCHEYIVDLNGAAAWRRTVGTNPKNARVTAARLLAKPNIKARVAELQTAALERAKLDADAVLGMLSQMARADIADAFDPETGALRPIHEIPVAVRAVLAGIKVQELHEGSGAERTKIGEAVELKWTKRLDVLALLGKHAQVGAFRDRLELELSLAELVAASREPDAKP